MQGHIVTIPSIVRQAQYDNLEAFADRVQYDGNFLKKWFEVEKKRLGRKRKKTKLLINLEESTEQQIDPAAQGNNHAETLIWQRTIFQKLK